MKEHLAAMRLVGCAPLLVCLVLLLGLAPTARAQSLSFIPLDHWSYQAFDRLVSLGVLPLHAIAARPITRREARRLLEEASAGINRARPAVAALARADLLRLTGEFSADPVAGVGLSGTAGNSPTGSAALPPVGGSSLSLRLAPPGPFVLVGHLGDRGGVPASRWDEAYASFQFGSVTAEFGKAAVSWSPSLRSSLLLSDNAGTLPLMRLVADFPRVRLTKVIASLERTGGSPPGGVVLFATRLDWLATPRFRLGLSETVVTTWGGPLTLYHLLEPIPVLSGLIASYDLHDALGQARNMAVTVDFDWVTRPGTRWYGSALIDDAAEYIGTRARVGILLGLELVDPFRTGRTSLRLEYSAISNGTYNYGLGLGHSYRDRSLGHWLGPDGDDLYVELTHRLTAASSLQLSYAYTRHGEGRIGQPAPPPEDWFLSGIVERRHTVALQLHRIHSRALETSYTAEIASVTNRGNVEGANGWEGTLRAALTYRWFSAASVPAPAAPAGQPSPVPPAVLPGVMPEGLSLRTWPTVMTSRGPLAGPDAQAAFGGVRYRIPLGRPALVLTADSTGQGQAFWSADLHYPLGQFGPAALSVFAGAGGLTHRTELGGTTRTFSVWGARLGAAFTASLGPNNTATPIYLTGEISSPPLRAILSPMEGGGRLNLWTYDLGLGWRGRSGFGLQAGYRGAAAIWRDGTPDKTFLRWDGFYLALAVRL